MFHQYLIYFLIIYLQQISNNLALARYSDESCPLLQSECLTKVISNNFKELVDGIPELGIEKLDKMTIGSANVERDGLSYSIDNVEVEGLKDAVINDIWVDATLKYIHLPIHTTLDIYSNYIASGNLLSLPVSGTGKAHLNKRNIDMDLLLLFDIKKDDNKKNIINLKAYRYAYDVGNGTVYRFENLYNGDKAKSEKFHDFIARNWRIVENGYARQLFDKITEKMFNAIKIFLQQFPFEDTASLK